MRLFLQGTIRIWTRIVWPTNRRFCSKNFFKPFSINCCGCLYLQSTILVNPYVTSTLKVMISSIAVGTFLQDAALRLYHANARENKISTFMVAGCVFSSNQEGTGKLRRQFATMRIFSPLAWDDRWPVLITASFYKTNRSLSRKKSCEPIRIRNFFVSTTALLSVLQRNSGLKL